MSLRIGVIGCGAIARRAHVPELQSAGARVVALTSRRVETAESLADSCPGADVVTDWRALLDRADVDAVVVSTPNAMHAEQVLAAVAAGKHVLVEKPMAISAAECAAVVDAVPSGLVVMPAHNARFAPLVVAARACAERSTPIGLRLALRNAGPLVWSPGSTWFVDPALSGGGALLDLGVHLLDVARYVLGGELTLCAARLQREDGLDVEAEVVLRSETGVDVEVAVSWRSSPGFELELTDGSGVIDVRPNLGVPADTVQAAFVRAVTTAAAYSPDARDGAAAVALALDAYAVAG